MEGDARGGAGRRAAFRWAVSKRASFNKDDCNVAGGLDGEQLKIYHGDDDDDDDDDDDAQPPAGHGESDFGNWMNASQMQFCNELLSDRIDLDWRQWAL